jgi:hypothetical protein
MLPNTGGRPEGLRPGWSLERLAPWRGPLILTVATLLWVAVAVRVASPLVLADEYVYAIRGLALDHLDRLQAIAPALPAVNNHLFLRLINLIARANLPTSLTIKLFNVACFSGAIALLGRGVLSAGSPGRATGLFALLAVLPIGSYVAYVMPESLYLLLFVLIFARLAQHRGAPTLWLWASTGGLIAVLTLAKAHGVFVFAAFLLATFAHSALSGRVSLRRALALSLASAAVFGSVLYLGVALLGPHGRGPGAHDVIGAYYWEVVARATAGVRVAATLDFAATQLAAMLLLFAPSLTFLVFGLFGSRRRAARGQAAGEPFSFAACFLLAVLCVVGVVVAFLLVAEPSRIQLRYLSFTFPCILALVWIWGAAEPQLDTPRFRLVAAGVWFVGAAVFLLRLPRLQPLAPDAPEMFFSYHGGEFGLGVAMAAVVAVLIAACGLALLHPRIRWFDAQLAALVVLVGLSDLNTVIWQGRWSAEQAPMRQIGDAARRDCGTADTDVVAAGGWEDASSLDTAAMRVGRPISLRLGPEAGFDPLALRPGTCVMTSADLDPVLGPPRLRTPGLALYRSTSVWQVWSKIPFDTGRRPAGLGSGWSGPERVGIWTDGPRATLRVDPPSDQTGPMVVELNAVAFSPPGWNGQRVDVSVAGRLLARWRVHDGDYFVQVPAGGRPGSPVDLVFSLPDAVAPASVLAGAADRRQLAIGVRQVKVLQAARPCGGAACRRPLSPD